MTASETQIKLYLSTAHPCSYLDDEMAHTAFIDPQIDMSMLLYSALAQQGFRRSGRMVYRQHCEDCKQCLSVRIPVDAFKSRRIHRRVLKANSDISIQEETVSDDPELYKLYQRYTAARHEDGEMKNSTLEEYLNFLTTSWSDTRFMVMRLHGNPVGVAVTDVLHDGLSAVYTFFDPDMPKRSLGTFGILQQIELAKTYGLPYLYLGFWVRDCQKMSYKTDYRPLQIYSEDRWKQFENGEFIDLPEL